VLTFPNYCIIKLHAPAEDCETQSLRNGGRGKVGHEWTNQVHACKKRQHSHQKKEGKLQEKLALFQIDVHKV